MKKSFSIVIVAMVLLVIFFFSSCSLPRSEDISVLESRINDLNQVNEENQRKLNDISQMNEENQKKLNDLSQINEENQRRLNELSEKVNRQTGQATSDVPLTPSSEDRLVITPIDSEFYPARDDGSKFVRISFNVTNLSENDALSPDYYIFNIYTGPMLHGGPVQVIKPIIDILKENGKIIGFTLRFICPRELEFLLNMKETISGREIEYFYSLEEGGDI